MNPNPSNSFKARPVKPHRISPTLLTHFKQAGVFSSEIFFPSKIILRIMIGGNKARADGIDEMADMYHELTVSQS